jgi:predicted CoA-binding protein
VADMDEITERILRTYDTITVVGASRQLGKEAHGVPELMRRHGWRIIAVNPHANEIFGGGPTAPLAQGPEQVGFADMFRPSGADTGYRAAGGHGWRHRPVAAVGDRAATARSFALIAA